jgi:ubiquinone/menaquinone biosynthesis C-methylase UbiE
MKKEIFPKKLINDYDFLSSVYPKAYKLREKVALIVKKYLSDSNKDNILEIGCGTGEATEVILKNTKNIKITAVDIDSTMIKNINKKLKRFIKNGRLKIVKEDIFKFIKKIDDNALDAVISSWTIHNFKKTDRQKLFLEIYRILKHNGLFVNMDKYVLDDPNLERKSFEKIIKQLNKLNELGRPDLAKTAIRHENDDRNPAFILKENESKKIMKKIGFKNINFSKRVGRETVLSCIK